MSLSVYFQVWLEIRIRSGSTRADLKSIACFDFQVRDRDRIGIQIRIQIGSRTERVCNEKRVPEPGFLWFSSKQSHAMCLRRAELRRCSPRETLISRRLLQSSRERLSLSSSCSIIACDMALSRPVFCPEYKDVCGQNSPKKGRCRWLSCKKLHLTTDEYIAVIIHKNMRQPYCPTEWMQDHLEK